jgi:hypothetical protein
VDGKAHPSHTNQVDQIIFGSNLVARWAWLVSGDTLEEIENDLLFLPGHWLNPILAELGHAHQAARQSHLGNIEAERQKLMAEMLVGLDI